MRQALLPLLLPALLPGCGENLDEATLASAAGVTIERVTPNQEVERAADR